MCGTKKVVDADVARETCRMVYESRTAVMMRSHQRLAVELDGLHLFSNLYNDSCRPIAAKYDRNILLSSEEIRDP